MSAKFPEIIPAPLSEAYTDTNIEFYPSYIGHAAHNTPIMIASNLKQVHEIFLNIFNVVVLCMDLPRAKLVTNMVDAKHFFNGEPTAYERR